MIHIIDDDDWIIKHHILIISMKYWIIIDDNCPIIIVHDHVELPGHIIKATLVTSVTRKSFVVSVHIVNLQNHRSSRTAIAHRKFVSMFSIIRYMSMWVWFKHSCWFLWPLLISTGRRTPCWRFLQLADQGARWGRLCQKCPDCVWSWKRKPKDLGIDLHLESFSHSSCGSSYRTGSVLGLNFGTILGKHQKTTNVTHERCSDLVMPGGTGISMYFLRQRRNQKISNKSSFEDVWGYSHYSPSWLVLNNIKWY